MNITFTMFEYKSAVFDSKTKRLVKTDAFFEQFKNGSLQKQPVAVRQNLRL